MKKRLLAGFLALLMILSLLPANMLSMNAQAADEDEYTNPSLAASMAVTFGATTQQTGPDISTVSVPGIPSVNAIGLFNNDYIRIDGAPYNGNDGVGGRVYVKNRNNGYSGWTYELGNIEWTDGVARPVMYEAANGSLSDGLAYQPAPLKNYTTTDGLVSYCIQGIMASPGGISTTMYSDAASLQSQVSTAGKTRAQRVVTNGYPLNEAYWTAKGIPAEAQRYATQVAIWCALKDEPGNDSYYYDAYLGTEAKYRSNIAVNGVEIDVMGMIRTLYNCAVDGTNVYAEPTASVAAKGISISGNNYVSTFTVSSTGNGGYAIKPLSVTGASVQVNGNPVTADASGWYTVGSSSAATVTVTYPVTNTGTIRLRAIPLDTRTGYSLWWAEGSGHTGSEGIHAGSTMQDMLVVKTQSGRATNNYGQASQTLPTVSVTIAKQDSETGGTTQGDAVLNGAVYGVYTANGTLVKQFPATDAAGKATVTGLLPGTDYYVQEITAPTGYQLSDQKDAFCVTSTNGMSNDVIPVSLTVSDTVIRQSLRLTKVEQGAEDVPVSGAGFAIYLSAEVLAANGASAYNTDAETGKIDLTGWTMPEAAADESFTDENGELVFENLAYGTYLLVETTAPAQYLEAAPILVEVGKDTDVSHPVELTVEEQRFTTNLQVVKVDAKTGKTVAQPGISFRLFDESGKKVVFEVADADGTVTKTDRFVTDSTGTVTLPGELECGRYYLQEVASPIGYLLDSTLIPVVVEKLDVQYGDGAITGNGTAASIAKIYLDQEDRYSFTADVSVSDIPTTVQIAKTDLVEGDGANELAGAKLTITAAEDISYHDGSVWKAAGEVVDTWVSGTEAHEISALPAGSYILTEETAPFGYSIAEEILFIVQETGEIQKVAMADVPSLGKLIVRKYEEDVAATLASNPAADLTALTGNAVTDVSVSGAEFTLYYASDVFDADGNLVHAAGDTAVDTDGNKVVLVTDRNGYAEYSNIPIGTYAGDGSWNAYVEYYLAETKTPEGYAASEERVPITFVWDETKTGEIEVEKTFSNQPLQPVIITKRQKDDVSILIADAGFTFYDSAQVLAENGLSEYPLDEEGKINLAGLTMPEPVVIGVNGETELFTDKDGTLTTSGLPYGEYLVVETTVPDTYLAAAPTLVTAGTTATAPVDVTISEELFEARITILKQTEDGEMIPQSGTAFELYNAAGQNITMTGTDSDGNEVVLSRFVTDETGTIVLPEKLPCGRYYLQEVTAPIGYATNPTRIRLEIKKLAITVGSGAESYQAVIDTDWDAETDLHTWTGTVVVLDKPLTVSIAKTDLVEGDGANELTGAKLTVTVAEDIYYHDGTLWKATGEVVDTWVSDAENPHVIEELPVGHYILTEETAPFGYSVAESMAFTVEDTAEIQSVVMADAPSLGRLVIDKYGQMYTEPEGTEEIEETEETEGTEESNPDLEGTAEITGETEPGETEPRETEPTEDTEQPLVMADTSLPCYQAEFTLYYRSDVYDADGNLVHAAGDVAVDTEGNEIILVTDENGHAEYSGIPIGTYKGDGSFNLVIEYELRETRAAAGFLLREDAIPVTFDWKETDVTEVVTEKTITDEFNRVIISKTNLVEGDGANELTGATLTIKAEKDIYDNTGEVIYPAGTVIDTWVSDAENLHYIPALPAGTYQLIEETAPFGYSIAESMVFTVEDSAEIQSVVMADAPSLGKLIVHKYAAGSDADGTANIEQPVEGTEFTLFYAADVLDAKGRVVYEAGDVAVDADGNKIILVTGENGYAEYSGIPIGTYAGDGSWNASISYKLKETKETTGYLAGDTAVPVTFTWTEEETAEIVQEYEFTNDYTKVEFVKTDAISGNRLSGGLFEVQDLDGTVIYSFTADENGVLAEAVLAPGQYRLVEVEAPEHFQIGSAVAFTVEASAELQMVIMADEPKLGYITTGTPTNGSSASVILGAGGVRILAGLCFIFVGISVLAVLMVRKRKKV